MMTTSEPAPDHNAPGSADQTGGHASAASPTPRLPILVRVLLVPIAMLLATLSPIILTLIPGFVSWGETLNDVAGTFAQVGFLAVASVTGVGLTWLLARGIDRRSLASCGWRFTPRTVPLLALGIALAVAAVLVGGLTVTALGWTRSGATYSNLSGTAAVLVVIIGLARGFLLQALPEELLFRGYLMSTLRDRPSVAVWVSTLLFTVMHLISNGGQENAVERVLYLATPFGMGLAGSALVLLTGSVWPAVGVHGGFHTGILIGAFIGLGDGPAVWISIGALLTVVGVVALAIWQRRRNTTGGASAAAPRGTEAGRTRRWR